MSEKISHEELVKRGCNFLRNKLNGEHVLNENNEAAGNHYISKCSFTVSELVTYSSEIPDVVGFNHCHTFMIECKTSMADFKRDSQKASKQRDDLSIGDFRFYLTPPDLLTAEDIPEGWGLIEVHGKKYKLIKRAQKRNNSLRRDREVMFSIISRISNNKSVEKYLKPFKSEETPCKD